MKGFTRTETRFSLCGLNCALCSMHLGGYCPGCGGGAGNQSCTIARCSLEHGSVSFCWQCPEYPCSRYEGFDEGDSFVPHRNRQQDITLALGLGVEAYLAQLEEKRAILTPISISAISSISPPTSRSTLTGFFALPTISLTASLLTGPYWIKFINPRTRYKIPEAKFAACWTICRL